MTNQALHFENPGTPYAIPERSSIDRPATNREYVYEAATESFVLNSGTG